MRRFPICTRRSGAAWPFNSTARITGENGVADGTRTHDNRNHNPGLYQLSYSHRRKSEERFSIGAPGGTRTHNPRLRRPVLYPVELRALESRLRTVRSIADAFETSTRSIGNTFREGP